MFTSENNHIHIVKDRRIYLRFDRIIKQSQYLNPKQAPACPHFVSELAGKIQMLKFQNFLFWSFGF